MDDLLHEARAALGAGDVEQGASLLEAALRADPESVDAAHLLGRARFMLGDHAGAAAILREASGRQPGSAELAHDLGFVLQRLGRFDEAEAQYRRAMELDGTGDGVGAQALAAMAELKRMTGDLDGAWELASGAYQRGVRDARVVITYARLCARKGEANQGGAILAQIINQLSDRNLRSEAAFALGEICDKLGRYDDAFRAYAHGNEMMSGRFDAEGYRRGVEQVILGWGRGVLDNIPRGLRSAKPIFIVGMFRSGTSLVEQILASHPLIAGAGELNLMQPLARELSGGAALVANPGALDGERLRRAASEQLDAMEAAAAEQGKPGAVRITDKTPTNYEHLGLIAAMFPQARIIHCVRDPLDTCLSIYFQRFEGRSACWTKLGWIGAIYRQYHALMGHWPGVIDLPVLHMPYEQLVDDLEGQTLRLLEFAGVPFHEACLRFHEADRVTMTASNEQVRQPIYSSSVGRWRNYSAHLGELRRALGMM
ncbi:MAG: tetratricopeptide repeat-containing sulfotransferase family protein [Phycisphaerales bacterium JB039]